ncbi:olfactory receptor 2AT4-like [Protopterus annectens]|uniref:olfactory receptor 2AT4-like n=1 Tax=Protopterus annectens TaxID=7888 RepID=UPI001CF9994E|nr:olfactory receptor 2AT4-like [Protopterus annectens]
MKERGTCSNTKVVEFILVGFPGTQNYRAALFLAFLIVYLIVLLGNSAIVAAVKTSHKLQKPMYFFLSNLAIVDILYTSTTIPKMLAIFLFNANTISFVACFTQVLTMYSFGTTEAFLLVVMAYDRYVAVCNPLRYMSIMTNKVNTQMAIGCWALAFTVILPPCVLTAQLPYCGSNRIEQFFCDHLYLIRLACTDTTFHTNLSFGLAMFLTLVPFFLVTVSYVKILRSVFKIESGEGRLKAFSTCSSHLIAVTLYYISLTIICVSYITDFVPEKFHSLSTVLPNILTPTLNPLIYTLRNKEVKDAITKLLKCKAVFPASEIHVLKEYALSGRKAKAGTDTYAKC